MVLLVPSGLLRLVAAAALLSQLLPTMYFLTLTPARLL
jgi:hypothetical protein